METSEEAALEHQLLLLLDTGVAWFKAVHCMRKGTGPEITQLPALLSEALI